MKPLLLEFSAADALAERLCEAAGLDLGGIERRQFPDGESYVRLTTPVKGRDVILLCSLDRPDSKGLALLFAAEAARNQGARSIGLVAPYLGYMRQDKAFRPGEAVTSQTFASLVSRHFDWLVALEPHLHRYPSLNSIYSVPAIAASASEPIGAWIRANVGMPVLIGPDEESAQWVGRIAGLVGASSMVFRKQRRGDFEVSLSADRIEIPTGATPVILDDIASSAHTMIEAVRYLESRGHAAPCCIAVHAIFAGDAYDQLRAAGAAQIVSTNSVAHSSNLIDIAEPLAESVSRARAVAAAR